MGRILFVLNLLWVSFTVVILAVLTVMILKEPGFPLGFGWLRTRGAMGLWITVPSILLGLIGLIVHKVRPAIGTRLLLLYSALWTLILLPGMVAELPTIVRHPLAYCADGKCTPWVITVGITILFALSAVGYASRSRSSRFPQIQATD